MAKGDKIVAEDLPMEIRFTSQSESSEKTEMPFKDFIKSQTEDVERQMIQKTLEECGGNVTRAAQHLGLSRKGLQLKMIRYNLRK
jgi:DNA-binding NtrC family response regulator